MTTRSLTEIANKYGSDKGTSGPSKEWGAHNYTDIYDAYLEKIRFFEISLLEIGIGVRGENFDAKIVHGSNYSGGASLKMWFDYFPNANILGIDINPASHLDNDRTQTFIVNQGSVEDLQRFIDVTDGIEFDVIIDDGSHRQDHP